MEKYFVSAILLFSIVILTSSCKKKEDDPAPTPPPTASVSFSFNGTAVPLSNPYGSTSTAYGQIASIATTTQLLSVGYHNGKPSTNTTIILPNSNFELGYVDENDVAWSATSGAVSVTVNQGFVTTSFTNLNFVDVSNGSAPNVTVNNGSITTN